ncbi:MAG: glycosyltransferase family 4 protein [Candidatus Krumholzibacteriota bacterium]
MVTPYLPHRRVGHGGGTAVRDLVTWLARKHEVMVAALVRPGEEGLLSEVEELGVSLAPIPFRDRKTRGLARASMLLERTRAWGRSRQSGFPWYVEKYWSPALARQVLKIAENFDPEVIQVEYLQLALLVRDLRQWRDDRSSTTPLLVLNSHELGSVPRERRAARAANPLAARTWRRQAQRWRRLQVEATGWADRTLSVTPEDHALFTDMGGRNLETVPLGMDLLRIKADWDPGPGLRLLFVGSFDHRPNRLAAEFLVKTMWPTVVAARPEARLTIVGRGSRAFLGRLDSLETWSAKGVEALGFVEDLTGLVRECHLFVAPLPEGGGIKIKILEAMARGIPVVTTPVGAEGISAPDEEAIVIAPCDEGFAPAVLAAIQDPAASRRRAETARRLIETRFSWDAITDQLTGIYKGR